MLEDYRIITPQQWNELRYRVADLANKILNNPDIANHCTPFALGKARMYLHVEQTTEANFDEMEEVERVLLGALVQATKEIACSIAYPLVIPLPSIHGVGNVQLEPLIGKATAVIGGNVSVSGSLKVVHIRPSGIPSDEAFGTLAVSVRDTAVATETIHILKQDEPHNLRWVTLENRLKRACQILMLPELIMIQYQSWSITEFTTMVERLESLSAWLSERPEDIGLILKVITNMFPYNGQLWRQLGYSASQTR